MNYYFFRAVTNWGPLNFFGYTDCHNCSRNTLWRVANLEGLSRKVIIESFEAEPISEAEYLEGIK